MSFHDARASNCELSPAASAFSAILSAFVGSIINGLANGWLVAFMTGWISWLAIFRVLMGGLYMFYYSLFNRWGPGQSKDFVDPPPPPLPLVYVGGQPPNTGSTSHLVGDHNNPYNPHENVYASGWQAIPAPGQPNTYYVAPRLNTRHIFSNIWPSPSVVRGVDQPAPGTVAPTYTPGITSRLMTPRSDLDRGVTIIGWFSLGYTAVFAPTTQILFLLANASRSDIGGAKLVKGLTVAITALPLCIDCRTRYADKLGAGKYALNLFLALSCLVQGGICAALLVTGVMDLKSPSSGSGSGSGSGSRFGNRPSSSPPSGFGPPTGLIVGVYIFFALIWMAVSFAILPMRDGGRKGAGKIHWAGYLIDMLVGAFAGIFLAAPAIALYSGATFRSGSSGSADLGEYLSCETEIWKKVAAVLP